MFLRVGATKYRKIQGNMSVAEGMFSSSAHGRNILPPGLLQLKAVWGISSGGSGTKPTSQVKGHSGGRRPPKNCSGVEKCRLRSARVLMHGYLGGIAH